MDAGGLCSMDNLSHKICIVRRTQEDDVGSLPVVDIITPTIQSRLAMKFRDLQQDEQIHLYHKFKFASEPDCRGLVDVFYEAFAQRKLQNGSIIPLFPMVKLEETQQGPQPQYYSSHIELINPNLEGFCQEALEKVYDIEIKPVQHEMFTDEGPLHIQEGIFYLPAATNHEASNSFILLNNILYIFQFNVGIKISLIPFFEKYKEQREVPPISSWRFIFIIDSNQTLICPQPQHLKLRELPLYTAVVEIPIHPSQAWL
jgi:hypothetical protein